MSLDFKSIGYKIPYTKTSAKSNFQTCCNQPDFTDRNIDFKNQLFNSPLSVSASVISFGQKKIHINNQTKKVSEIEVFPHYRKVPDGFKYKAVLDDQLRPAFDKKGKLKSYYPDDEQVTVIDRRHDTYYQAIKRDFDSKVPQMKEDWKEQGRYDDDTIFWKEYLKKRTAEYITNSDFAQITKNAEKTPEYPKLGEKESYLGKIFSEGNYVCRHKSYLMKLLLEDYRVPIGIKNGYVINKICAGGHSWNETISPEGKKQVFDWVQPSDSIHFDNRGNILYSDTLKPQERVICDIYSLNPYEVINIGFDKYNWQLGTEKTIAPQNFLPVAKARVSPKWNIKFIKYHINKNNPCYYDAKRAINSLEEFFTDTNVDFLIDKRFIRSAQLVDEYQLDKNMDKNIDNLIDLFLKADPSLNLFSANYFAKLY